jgi:WD40 repeat protein
VFVQLLRLVPLTAYRSRSCTASTSITRRSSTFSVQLEAKHRARAPQWLRANSTESDVDMRSAKHLLHWLEVLSLLGELMPAEGHLPKMIAWCQVNVLCIALMSSNQEQQHHFADLPLMQDIAELLRDVYRALQLYAYLMASHALQVYHSILATLPHCRLLDHTEKTQTVTPCLVSPRSSDWSSLVKVIEGHTGFVLTAAFSPNGAHIVSGSYDETIRVWDAMTGKQLGMLKGHTGWVFSVAFSPDGAHIVSGSADDTIRIWNAHTGKQLAVFKGHTYWVLSAALSPDGAHIVSGSGDGTVRVWDVDLGKQVAVLEGHTGWVFSVAFSPDGAHIVSGSGDKTVRLWSAHTGKQLAVLEDHKDGVWSVAFSSDGKCITSQNIHGAELAWDLTSVLLHEQSHTHVVAPTLLDVHDFTSAEGPLDHLPPTPTGTLVWNEESGWISWQRSRTHSVRLCWLPHERRGYSFASHDMTAAIGARHGAVTILTFSDVIAMLDTLV